MSIADLHAVAAVAAAGETAHSPWPFAIGLNHVLSWLAFHEEDADGPFHRLHREAAAIVERGSWLHGAESQRAALRAVHKRAGALARAAEAELRHTVAELAAHEHQCADLAQRLVRERDEARSTAEELRKELMAEVEAHEATSARERALAPPGRCVPRLVTDRDEDDRRLEAMMGSLGL